MSRASKKEKKAPETPLSTKSQAHDSATSAIEPEEPRKPSHAPAGKFTPIFLVILLLIGMVYTASKMTPSSYGIMLTYILAPEDGPTLGASRPIRSDEWAILTPQVQAAVRNHFQRFNQTSFYGEDMRNYFMPPLRDWGLIFRPETWLFFVTSPALAFSAYWAFFMGLFIAGYYLMFVDLGVAPVLACAASLALFFCGFSQFWWTTNGPIITGLPWVIWVILRPIGFVTKALLLTWIFTAWAMAMPYAPLLVDTAWAIPVVLLAVRPRVAASWRELGAVVLAALAASILLYVYFSDAISVMRNTVYPGQRVSPPGTVPFAIWVSQLFPFLTFNVNTYESRQWNICEVGTVGTYFPILTLCLLRYSKLREEPHRDLRRALWIFGAAILLAGLWQIAPAPLWMGRILLWNRTNPQRLFFFSGLVLLIASLILWKRELLSFSWWRIALFVLAGPVAGVVLKPLYFGQDPTDYGPDLTVCATAAVVCLALSVFPYQDRMPALLVLLVGINLYGFGGFNPLQSAVPIFEIPETKVMTQLRTQQAQSPGGYLVQPGFPGSVLNGMGFRSVAHTLVSPQLAIFRKYFPDMEASQFNLVFNRYANIHLSDAPVPSTPQADVVEVPAAVFLPGSSSSKHGPFTGQDGHGAGVSPRP